MVTFKDITNLFHLVNNKIEHFLFKFKALTLQKYYLWCLHNLIPMKQRTILNEFSSVQF